MTLRSTRSAGRARGRCRRGCRAGRREDCAVSGIRLGDWWHVGGGEAGHIAADPKDPDVIYATEYGGYLSRYDRRTRQALNVSVYPFNPSGHAAEDVKYRFQWTSPVLVSPHDSRVVYHAGVNQTGVRFIYREGGGSRRLRELVRRFKAF